ncbi:hypothetical protein JY572_16350 [Myxococcus landrumensis]|uniref:Uncharacterized protein n=2 Tax=Myxococcus landrumensis TaxID=2813577 RepID=A0ABX7NIV0_9BACT|nr:hypothetical protein JY572_16350 [Myxococcus landrumus]
MGLAVRINYNYSTRKKWAVSRLEGQDCTAEAFIADLRQRPLFDLPSSDIPSELHGAVPEAEFPALRARMEALLDLTVRLGGRAELAEFTLDGEVRCFLWEGKKRAFPVRHEDPRVKTDFVMLQKHCREAVLKYKPPRTDALRCSCGASVEPTAVTCARCARDFTVPIGIAARPKDPERLRPLRTRIAELKFPLPKHDVFKANVYGPRNALEALLYDELLPKAGLTLLQPQELASRVALLSELGAWLRRHAFLGPDATPGFIEGLGSILDQKSSSSRKCLERWAKDQGHLFQAFAAVEPGTPGWLAAEEVSGVPLHGEYQHEWVCQAVDFLRRFSGARGELSSAFLEKLEKIAPDLLSAKERKRRAREVDVKALDTGEGFGEYLERLTASVKSPAQAISAVLRAAGDPDDEDDSIPTVLKDTARAAVEWLVDGRRPEVGDVEGDWLARQFKAVQRAKSFPKVIVKRAEEARLHPAPFGLPGERTWDVQPAAPSAADLKSLAACPECNRRVKPSQVFHVPALGKGTEGRTLRFYECERCDRAMLFARGEKLARARKAPVNAFTEYASPLLEETQPPPGFMRWRFERFVTRQLQGKKLALQFGGLPVTDSWREPVMGLRCNHSPVSVRIHTDNLDLQPAFGADFMMGNVCMTPGCKKPDVRTERDD